LITSPTALFRSNAAPAAAAPAAIPPDGTAPLIGVEPAPVAQRGHDPAGTIPPAPGTPNAAALTVSGPPAAAAAALAAAPADAGREAVPPGPMICVEMVLIGGLITIGTCLPPGPSTHFTTTSVCLQKIPSPENPFLHVHLKFPGVSF